MDAFTGLRDALLMAHNRMTLQTFNRVWCKMMLHRYMGAYLENNLSVDQLSLQLADGHLELENLYINTKAISQHLTQAGVPVKLVDGYLGKIKIEIPWLRLMTDPTKMIIEDLQLTFRGADVFKQEGVFEKETIASMIGSVISGLNSEEMARSVFDEVSKENNIAAELLGGDNTADSFSDFINAVYSRFCLTIKHMTIRLENCPKDGSETATALEIHVEMTSFMDEQMRSCEVDKTNASDLVTTQPHGGSSTSNLNKHIKFQGIKFSTDIFTNITDDHDENVLITSMHIRREKAKQMSPTKSPHDSLHSEMFQSAMSDMDAFHSCYDKLAQETQPDQLETLRTAPTEPSLFSDPIKCAEVIGDVTCLFRQKTAESDVSVAEISETKIEFELFMKGVHVFVTPSQIEILKRFSISVMTPKEVIILQQGKPMGKEDYENMTKNMEQNHSPEVPLRNTSFGNNWQQGEVFSEFETRKSSKQNEKSFDKEFKTLKSNDNVKVESTVQINLGTALIYIPHTDYLSAEYALQHGGYANVLDVLKRESDNFFKAVEGFSFMAKYGLATVREAADSFYPKDHLRIVGGSLAVTFSSRSVANHNSAQCRVVATHFDMLEYLTTESAPGSNGPLRINVLDYTKQENIERDPNFKLVCSTSTDKKGVSNVDILLGACTSELDFSIIDRISNLIVTRPFFDEVSAKHSKHQTILQLKDDIYAADTILEEDKKTVTNVNLKCPKWEIDLRIPKADLRDPNGSRIPFAQRHVHNEFIRLGIKDIDVSIPIENEMSLIEFCCSEMFGDFCGDSLDIPKEQERFLFASRSGLEKIKLKLVLNPKNRKLAGAVRKSSSGGIPDIMMKSVSADIMMAHPKQEGPFSKIPRSYCSHSGEEKEEIIQAGTRREIFEFQEECETLAATLMYFTVPSLKLHTPEKNYLEVLYNRLVNDLALFQPAAPAFRVSPVDAEKLLPLDSFQECISPKQYAESENSDLEDDVPTMHNSTESGGFDREVPHTFVMTLNANKCTVLCNTSVKEDEKEAQRSQVSLDLEKVHIGTTVGYHGDINHTFFHFTSSKAAVGSVDLSKDVRLPNVITQKDFGKWSKDLTQLDFVPTTDELSSGSTEDAFAVALHMQFKPDENVKDVLLGIALRNSQLQAKPFKFWSAFWMAQLAEHFTLQDYAIPGYELPAVSTDFHICFENAIVGYDHSWTNPSSKLKLRAALGQCNLASSIVSDMNISKTLCIFENCRLYMSQDSLKEAVRFEGHGAPKNSTKKFISFLDIGSVQLDILFAVGESTEQRTAPAFEIRCQNDIIEAWACADSLAAFIKMVMEYTSDDPTTIKTPEVQQQEEMEKSLKNEDINRSVAGESIWSDASTGSKHIQKMSVGAPLPDDVDRRIRAMIEEAVNEDDEDESSGIAIGEDAVQEFSMTPTKRNPNESNDSFEHVAHRNFNITDEEFCMVDDTVFGSGITNTPGDSRVRMIPGPPGCEDFIVMRSDFFTPIDDFGNDGLYQQMGGKLNPVLRYLLKDVTIRLSLYAGNDLSMTPAPLKTYCTEDYKNGFGPEQKLLESSRGGPNRDHSAFVILELNKITYLKQIFDKTAPLLSTTLFRIGDAIIKDRVQASTIQEMLYQYSCTKNPRRTNAPILSVRMSETHSREGKMKVSMLPIKINVDQDTLEFLTDFFEEFSNFLDLPKHRAAMPPLIQRPVIEVPAEPTSKKNTPKTSVSSSDEDVTRMYPSIPVPASSLTLEPLKPSPVQPATPLGDLSYLEKISQNHSSPVKRPIIDAPLTASAVSIGAMFDTGTNRNGDDFLDDEVDSVQMDAIKEEMEMLRKIQHPNGSDTESSYSDSNSDADEAPIPPPRSQRKQSKLSNAPDMSDLAGDWADNDNLTYTTSEGEQLYIGGSPNLNCEVSPIKKHHHGEPAALEPLYGLDDIKDMPHRSPLTSSPIKVGSSLKMKAEGLPPLKMPHQPMSHDDILMRSTMMGSVHPTQTVHNLVDTSDNADEEFHGNFLDSIDDEENEQEKQAKQKVEQEMDDHKVRDAAALNPEIQEAVERGETFFKHFVFSPSVNIYVDYQGKRKISVEKAGALVGLLMAFGQLNQMPIELREINTHTGLLGTGRCLQHAIGEWSGDLLTNMPSVIASYGPISPLVQIGRGVVDLFWMPVSEFRKNDGNVVKGLQRGVGSFSVSSAAGIVGMAQTVTGFVQSLAEMTMREIKPDDPSTRRAAFRRYNRNHGMNPTDVRHSLQLAYGILYDGYHQTRDDLELAAQEDRASGNSVVRSAFRYAVPTFLGPIVMATQVTYQLLGGLRNQLRPDAYQDERRKWGEKDVPGGVNNK